MTGDVKLQRQNRVPGTSSRDTRLACGSVAVSLAIAAKIRIRRRSADPGREL